MPKIDKKPKKKKALHSFEKEGWVSMDDYNLLKESRDYYVTEYSKLWDELRDYKKPIFKNNIRNFFRAKLKYIKEYLDYKKHLRTLKTFSHLRKKYKG